MVSVYTDGGIDKKVNRGSWAFVIVLENEECFCESGTEEDTTSNRMEITAIMNAIKFCIENEIKIDDLITDSQYCMNSYNKWMHGWGWNGWKSSTGQEVKNKDLWIKMSEIKTNRLAPKNLSWVKGHNGNKFNERADFLCNKELGRV